MAIDVCPYCASPMSSDRGARDERTKDHAFWQALGGRATVDACRNCNSTIGSEIEGKLSRGNELYTRREWRGTVVVDDELESVTGGPPSTASPCDVAFVDVRTGQARPEPRVIVNTVGRDRHYRIEAFPDQARRILKRLAKEIGWDSDRIEYEIANARHVPWSPRVVIEVNHDLNLGRRLAAKMLLGAGALADPNFVRTDLADTFAISSGLGCLRSSWSTTPTLPTLTIGCESTRRSLTAHPCIVRPRSRRQSSSPGSSARRPSSCVPAPTQSA